MTINRLLIRFATVAIVAAPSWCGTIQFSTSSVQVQPGTSFTLDVVASDVFDLYAYAFDLTWNPAVLRATGVTGGAFLPTAGSTFFDGGTVDNQSGIIGGTYDTLIGNTPGASGSGVLVTIAFEALSLGSTDLGFSNVITLDSGLNDSGLTVEGGNVTVTESAAAAPEPGTWMMMGLGLLGVWFGGRRRR